MGSLSGGNGARRAGLGRGRARGSGTGPWCFPSSAASRSGRTEIFPPCSALSHGGSQKWLRGGTGALASVLPPGGKARGSPKARLGLARLCPLLASAPCAGAPGLVGRGKSSWEEGASPPQAPLAAWLGQGGPRQGSVPEGTGRRVGRMLRDGAAGPSRCALVQHSALSWLLLGHSICCSLSAEAELRPEPPQHPAAVRRFGMTSRTAWLGRRAGQCVHGAASLAGSQTLLPFPSSPFSHLPFSHPLLPAALPIS